MSEQNLNEQLSADDYDPNSVLIERQFLYLIERQNIKKSTISQRTMNEKRLLKQNDDMLWAKS